MEEFLEKVSQLSHHQVWCPARCLNLLGFARLGTQQSPITKLLMDKMIEMMGYASIRSQIVRLLTDTSHGWLLKPTWPPYEWTSTSRIISNEHAAQGGTPNRSTQLAGCYSLIAVWLQSS